VGIIYIVNREKTLYFIPDLLIEGETRHRTIKYLKL
jgi:hypothetical protein